MLTDAEIVKYRNFCAGLYGEDVAQEAVTKCLENGVFERCNSEIGWGLAWFVALRTSFRYDHHFKHRVFTFEDMTIRMRAGHKWEDPEGIGEYTLFHKGLQDRGSDPESAAYCRELLADPLVKRVLTWQAGDSNEFKQRICQLQAEIREKYGILPPGRSKACAEATNKLRARIRSSEKTSQRNGRVKNLI